MSAPIEWLSIRFEGPRAPTSEDLARYHEAVTEGMVVISEKLGTNALPRTEVQARLTVYPLTCCADIHHELVVVLRFCLRYDGGECLGDHPEWLARARAALATAGVA